MRELPFQCLLLTLIPQSPFLKYLPFLQMLKMLPAVLDASAAIVDLSFEVPGSGCPILVVRYSKAISSVPPIPASYLPKESPVSIILFHSRASLYYSLDFSTKASSRSSGMACSQKR